MTEQQVACATEQLQDASHTEYTTGNTEPAPVKPEPTSDNTTKDSEDEEDEESSEESDGESSDNATEDGPEDNSQSNEDAERKKNVPADKAAPDSGQPQQSTVTEEDEAYYIAKNSNKKFGAGKK